MHPVPTDEAMLPMIDGLIDGLISGPFDGISKQCNNVSLHRGTLVAHETCLFVELGGRRGVQIALAALLGKHLQGQSPALDKRHR
ncbi:uncharacterized protein PgNI_00475 [Pyricularia grisea]|uniref:Uncharacterized protein n=1 Tax=Pyricularia grisea TaxID=148305 RepID=A0A6P8BL81_PYRGI|nr:uncharacterized protein PgNI_00475 [Pyricularia grisea]TLD17558.1 hypothetical protein PgNI_00475 [Pyricularia grisea]